MHREGAVVSLHNFLIITKFWLLNVYYPITRLFSRNKTVCVFRDITRHESPRLNSASKDNQYPITFLVFTRNLGNLWYLEMAIRNFIPFFESHFIRGSGATNTINKRYNTIHAYLVPMGDLCGAYCQYFKMKVIMAHFVRYHTQNFSLLL